MTPYLTCDAAAELLDAFVDHELPLEEQVAVESHLRWCRVCDARVEDMRVVGEALRERRGQRPADSDIACLQSSVLTRLRAERDQSLGVRFRGLFEDMRLFWPAVGATVAVATCLFGALNVFIAATEDESRESLAGIIDVLANPGSDENPMSLGIRLSAPRALDADAVLDLISDDEAVYALSAVVTKEGRVSNSEFLRSERASNTRRSKAPTVQANLPALLEAAKRSRFEPAQNESGSAVAVNLVWLVARTTVKGSARFEFAPLRETRPAVIAPDRRPADGTPGRQSGGAVSTDLPAV